MPADRHQANQRVGITQTDSGTSMTPPPPPAQGRFRDEASHSGKQQTERSHRAHGWLCHQRPVRVEFHCQARYEHHPRRQCCLCKVSTSSLTVEMEAVAHSNRWIALRSDSETTHATLLTESISWLQKGKSEMGNSRWHVTGFKPWK